MTDCLRKLAEALNKVDVSKLSPTELAAKLGMELGEFLTKIGNDLDAIGDELSEPDFGKISEKFADLINQNILFDTLSEGADLLIRAGEIIEEGGDYIGDKVADGINSITSLTLEDIVTAPFDLAASILSEVNDQINKHICNGNLLENLAGILGDIDGTIGKILNDLTPTEIKKLLEDSKFGELLTNLLKGTIIVKSLLDNVEAGREQQRWVAPPTNLTVNNPALPTSINTNLDSLSGLVIDETAKGPINGHFSQGGPWDFDIETENIFKFSFNDVFVFKGDDFALSTDADLKKFLSDKYEKLFELIDFNITEDTSQITPVNSKTENLELGDYVFNIGVTGDTDSDQEGNFHTTEITFVYGINKRLKVTPDDCDPFETTKLVLVNTFSNFGLGNTLSDSRINASVECREKVVDDIVNNKEKLMKIFNDLT